MDFQLFLHKVSVLDELLWQFIGAPVLIITSLYLSLRSGFFQIRGFSKTLKLLFGSHSNKAERLSMVRSFFASVGGAVGIGNVAGVCVAVKYGGPGAVLWIWIAAIFGILLKYCEVFLGVKFGCGSNGFMSYLSIVFPGWLVKFCAVLVCIYGIEIYQFNVTRSCLSYMFGVDDVVSSVILLVLVILGVTGGFKRIGTISSFIIPPLCAGYLCITTLILFKYKSVLLPILGDIVYSAFSGHAAVGAFLGCSVSTTVGQGMARGCYATDIGTGYSAIVYSKNKLTNPKHAAYCVLAEPIFNALGVCSLSLLVVLVTGIWFTDINPENMVEQAIRSSLFVSKYPFKLFLFILGYSTLLTFFRSGVECAKFLNEKFGPKMYTFIGSAIWLCCSFVPADNVLVLMSICGFLLLIINISAIFLLRNEVEFD